MAAMHEDDSPELTEVARILNDVLEVDESLVSSLGLFVHQMNFFFFFLGQWDHLVDAILVLFALSCVFQIPDVPLKVRKLIVKICDVVTRRAARLAAAGIVGILKKIGRDGSGGISSGRSRSDIRMRRTVVAIEGGLYSSYTLFREYLHEALTDILGDDIAQHVILMVTEDGSGIGAALLAASHSSYSVDTVQPL